MNVCRITILSRNIPKKWDLLLILLDDDGGVLLLLPSFQLTRWNLVYSMWKNLHARKIVVLCMLLSSLLERMEQSIKKNGLFFSSCFLSLWNLLKIAYMLLTYRLEWIINQDRNYEWNLIFHIYIQQCANFLFPSVAAIIIIICWCSLSLTPYSFPKPTLYTLYAIQAWRRVSWWGKNWCSEKKREEEKGEGFNDMKRMKRKLATQQGKSSIWAVEIAWGKSSNIVYNQFTVFYFATKQKKQKLQQQQLNRKWETTTSRNRECDWQQKQLDAEEETITVCIA